MTLARKGRRKLMVDGIAYHWIATSTRRSTSFAGGEALYAVSTLIVERALVPAQRLQVMFDSRALYDSNLRAKYVDYLAITPGVVVAAIRYARQNGWSPESNGAAFRIGRGEVLFEAELRAALHKGSRWGPPSKPDSQGD
jgi:hypothetical protein